jgi:hypothetical protein
MSPRRAMSLKAARGAPSRAGPFEYVSTSTDGDLDGEMVVGDGLSLGVVSLEIPRRPSKFMHIGRTYHRVIEFLSLYVAKTFKKPR